MKAESRKKSYRITLRLDEKELLQLDEICKKNNLDRNKLLRKLIMNSDKNILDLKNEVEETNKLARYISNNLNQIARKINSEEHLKIGYDFVKELKELWQYLRP